MDNFNSLTEFDRIEFRSRVAVAWGFLWRAVLTTIASGLGGAIAGFVLGAGAAIVAITLGVSTTGKGFLLFAQILGALVGLTIGILLFWQYIRWLFRAKLGGYHLRLVRDVQDAV